jgi:hypothetical protein
MTYRFGLISLLVATTTVGCFKVPMVLTPQGLDDASHGYHVSYAEGANARFLSESWRLDNFYKPSWGGFSVKDTDAYVTEYAFDTDGDGKPNTTEKLPTYALRFENTRSLGVIWLRAIPLHAYDGQKELRGLMHNWVNAWSGTEADFFRVGDRVVYSSINIATKCITEAPATLAGFEAYSSTYDVAIVEQLKLDPEARIRRAKTVMVRSGLVHKVSYQGEFPLLLVASVSDMPESFDKSVAEFDAFLNLITIDNKRGFVEKASQQTAPAKPVVPTESAGTSPEPVSPAGVPAEPTTNKL